MQAVLDEGMVKAIGVSEGSTAHIRSIHSIVPVSLIELEWSLFTRESEVNACCLKWYMKDKAEGQPCSLHSSSSDTLSHPPIYQVRYRFGVIPWQHEPIRFIHLATAKVQ